MKYIPASPLDIFQLKLGDTEQACRISVAVKLSGKIDEENLRQAADRAAAEQPVLTSRYRGDGHAGRFIAGTEPIPIPIPITDQHPDRVMTTLFPYHGALFEITVCRGTTDTIVFSAAHLLTDARGLITLAGRIAELFRCPQQKNPPDTTGRLRLHSNIFPRKNFRNFLQKNISGSLKFSPTKNILCRKQIRKRS